MTSHHRPSRWLAPLALLAAVAAVFAVVSTSTGGGEGDAGPAATTAQRSGDARADRSPNDETSGEGTATAPRTTPARRTYTVRPGDTLARISERTGVSVEELQELNPGIDPNSLTVGRKIKLTE